jgi:hypothetical protein
VTSFTASCGSKVYLSKPLAIDAMTNIKMPTEYHVKYIFNAAFVDGTSCSDQFEWGDSDDRGTSKSFAVDIYLGPDKPMIECGPD